MAAVEPAGLDAVTRVVSGTAADNAAERKKDVRNQRDGVHAHDAEKADVAGGQEEEDLNDDDGQQELGRSSTVDSQKLPYSKPRMVVLVLNVAGAAFLNVCAQLFLSSAHHAPPIPPFRPHLANR